MENGIDCFAFRLDQQEIIDCKNAEKILSMLTYASNKR